MLTLQNDKRSLTPFIVVALESDWRSFLRAFLTLDGDSLDMRLELQGDRLVFKGKCGQAELEMEGWREEEFELRLLVRGEVEGEARLASDFSSGEIGLTRSGLIFMHLKLLKLGAGKIGYKVEYKTEQSSGEWSYQVKREGDFDQFEACWKRENVTVARHSLNISMLPTLTRARMDFSVLAGSWLHHLLGFHSISSWTGLDTANTQLGQNWNLFNAEQTIRVDGQEQPNLHILLNSRSSLVLVHRGREGSREELNIVWDLQPCAVRTYLPCLSSISAELGLFQGDNRRFQYSLKYYVAGDRKQLDVNVLGKQKRDQIHIGVSLPASPPLLNRTETKITTNFFGIEDVFQVTGNGNGHFDLHRGGDLLASAQLQNLGNANILARLPQNSSVQLMAAVNSGAVNLVANLTGGGGLEDERLCGTVRYIEDHGWSLVLEGRTPQLGEFALSRCLQLREGQLSLYGKDSVARGPFSIFSPFSSLLRVVWTPSVELTGWAGKVGGPEWGLEGNKQGLETFRPSAAELDFWDQKAHCEVY